MIDDVEWWVFRMPEATAYVPAESEEAARASLASNCYKGAPVHRWPLISTRVCSRDALSRYLLRKAAR